MRSLEPRAKARDINRARSTSHGPALKSRSGASPLLSWLPPWMTVPLRWGDRLIEASAAFINTSQYEPYTARGTLLEYPTQAHNVSLTALFTVYSTTV